MQAGNECARALKRGRTMSRAVWAALLLVLALAALPAAAAPEDENTIAGEAAAPAALDREFMGMVIRDPYYDFDTASSQPNRAAQDRMGQFLADAGVRWVRLDFLADPDGHVDFAKYDYFIGTVAPRHGFKVLGLIGTASIRTFTERGYYPMFLNIDPATMGHDVYGYGLNQYMIEWLDEALRIAERYDGSNPQAGRVHAFETFNEVNRLFGDGSNLDKRLEYAGMDPERVARMHAKFYRICKNADGLQPTVRCPADTQIVVGGLHAKGTSNPRNSWQKETFIFTDQQYLQRMYETAFSDSKAVIGRWPVDGIGYHPYPEEIRLSPNNSYVDKGLNRMRDTIDQNDPGRPFWITEVGYNVGFRVNGVTQTEAGQAAFMRDVYTSLHARGDVATLFWFKYEDFPPAGGANAQRWGIVRIPFEENSACPGGACYEPSGQPAQIRQSFFAYRELAGVPTQRFYTPLIRR
jgi:hypothetical protein